MSSLFRTELILSLFAKFYQLLNKNELNDFLLAARGTTFGDDVSLPNLQAYCEFVIDIYCSESMFLTE